MRLGQVRIEGVWLIALAGAVVIAAALLVFGLSGGRGGGPTAGDYLSFAGGVLGSVFAVAGALAVEKHRRENDRRLDLRLTRDALETVARALRMIQEPAKSESLAERRRHALTLLASFEDAQALLEFAQAQARIRDIDVFLALRAVDRALLSEQSLVERETAIVRENKPTEAIMDIYQRNMRNVAETCLPVLESALSQIARRL